MAKKSQLIFAKGKAQALDSLFIGDNPPFGYLAIGYTDSSKNRRMKYKTHYSLLFYPRISMSGFVGLNNKKGGYNTYEC